MSVCNFTFVNNAWTPQTQCPSNLYCPILTTDCDIEPCTSLCEEWECTYQYNGKKWESITQNCDDQDTFWANYYCTSSSCNTNIISEICQRNCENDGIYPIPVIVLCILAIIFLYTIYINDKPKTDNYLYFAKIEVIVFWLATIGLVIGLLDSNYSTWAGITLVSTILMGIIPLMGNIPMLKSCFNKKLLSVAHIITSLVVLLGLTLIFGKSFEKEAVSANLAFYAAISFVFSISASHYAYIEKKVNNKNVSCPAVYLIALLAVIIPIVGFAFYDWLGYVLFTGVALLLAYAHKGVLLKTDANAASGGTGGGVGWRQLRVIYR